jgi:hypothetical protein
VGKKAEEQYRYQWACHIVDVYEQTAIRKGTRAGAMVMARAPLEASLQVLESSERILQSFTKTAVSTDNGETSRNATWSARSESGSVDLSGCQSVLDPSEDFTGLELTNPSVGIEAHVDPLAQAAEAWNDAADKLGLGDLDIDVSKMKEYMEECLQCDFQIDFDWQIQPVNLLGPINDLLNDIEGIADQFSSRIDPFNMLNNLCDTFEGFRFTCVPDLFQLIMSLQMLLKKYIMFGLDIRIDWTAIAGPLLKVIIDAIVTFLQQIVSILLAPIDCVLTNLKSVDELLNESIKTANMSIAAGQALGDTFGKGGIPGLAGETELDVSGYVNLKKETGEDDDRGFGNLFTTGSNSIFNFDASSGSGAEGANIPIGFRLGANDTFDSRMKDPTIKYASPLQQAIMMVQEAREYMASLFDNILYSFKSLNAFVAGGIGLQMNNAGMIMAILDMISLIKMLAGLLGKGGADDWCQMIKDNPDLVRSYFEGSYPNMEILSGGKLSNELKLKAGPWEGTLQLDSRCAGQRTTEQQQMLTGWISDLERSMR